MRKKRLTMHRKWTWIKSYTIIFALSSLLLYSLNILYGKSFVFSGVNLTGDGLVQHYTALAYYGEYLRTIVKNIFVLHTFSIPEFDMSIGLGGSIVTTLGYEVLGDPLNLLAMFIPMQYTEHLYIFLVIVRLYLAGIAFCQYCFYHSYAEWQVFPGMMVYVFSFYTVAVSVLHPFFLNPLIYFPLILLSVDKIFRENRHMSFILFCVLAAVSNFYFFYMITIMLFLYSVPYIARIFVKEGKWRQGIWKFGELLSCYLVSLMFAAPIFLPMAMAVLNSGRVGGSKPISLFYELIYYVKLPIAFVNFSADHYAHLGYGAVAVLAVWMLFLRTNWKEKLSLKVAFIIGTIFLLFPFFGSALNGFGYATNRWVWAYGFMVSMIVVSQFPAIIKLGRRMVWVLTGATLLCMVPTFYVRAGGEKGKLLVAAVVLLAVGVLLCAVMLLMKWRKNGIMIACMTVISANIFLSMFGFYSPLSGDYLKDCGSWGRAWQDMADGPLSALERLDQGEWENVRVDTSNLSMAGVRANSAMLWDVNSISFYFSMIDGSSTSFLHEMQLPTPFENQYVDLDGRALLSSLLGVKYQIVRQGEEDRLPFGYDRLVQERNGYALYETDYALPLAFMYDRVIGETDYQALDVAEKQQAMMQAAAISEEDMIWVRALPTVRPEELEYSHWNSAYGIDSMQGVSIHDNQYVVTEAGAYIQLETDCSYGAERYFIFENLWYEGTDSAQIMVSDGIELREFTVNSVASNYYAGVHDFVCNMGYSENHGSSYRIIFSTPGTYSLDGIRICNQPLEQLRVWSRAERRVEGFSSGEDEFTMRAEAENDSLLYLSIPYSVGWTAWVDGEKATIMKTNHFGIGIYLPSGEHSIRLEYHTPYLRFGLLLMAVGVLGCLVVLARRGGKRGCDQ